MPFRTELDNLNATLEMIPAIAFAIVMLFAILYIGTYINGTTMDEFKTAVPVVLIITVLAVPLMAILSLRRMLLGDDEDITRWRRQVETTEPELTPEQIKQQEERRVEQERQVRIQEQQKKKQAKEQRKKAEQERKKYHKKDRTSRIVKACMELDKKKEKEK